MFIEKQKILSQRRRKLIDCASPAEKAIQAKLKEAKIKHIFQKGFIAGNGFYIVDFYLPKPLKICLEIDGSSHIGREKYDFRRTKYLESRKFKVIRISNQEALNISPEGLSALIFHA